MNSKLEKLFNLYRNLRSVQEIVQEILTLDYYVYKIDLDKSIKLIDFCLTKYNREIKLISGMRRDKVVVEDDRELYDNKDDEEINSDLEYIRDCVIMIGAVKSGIRSSLREVYLEVY